MNDTRRTMNWQTILSDLRRVMTLQEIADGCGLASRGAVHNLLTGKQATVSYEIGAKLVSMHSENSRAIKIANKAKGRRVPAERKEVK